MKRFTALLFAFAFVLCSCAHEPPAITVKRALALPFEAEIACGETVMHACVGEETWKVSFSAPEALCGLKLRGESGASECEVSLDGFVRAAGAESFPVAQLLVNAVYAANGKGETKAEREGICAYTIDETAVMVYYDTESGTVTAVSAEKNGKEFEYRVIR